MKQDRIRTAVAVLGLALILGGCATTSRPGAVGKPGTNKNSKLRQNTIRARSQNTGQMASYIPKVRGMVDNQAKVRPSAVQPVSFVSRMMASLKNAWNHASKTGALPPSGGKGPGTAGQGPKDNVGKTSGGKKIGGVIGHGKGGPLAGSAGAIAASDVTGTGTSKTSSSALKIIGFVTNDNTKGKMGMPGLKYLNQHPHAVSALVPLWYTVQSDGSLKTHTAAGVRAWAKAHNVSITPLVNNKGYQFLMNPSTRRTAANNVAKMVVQNGFAGVSIDFELLPSNARVPLTTFMDELSADLHQTGKTLTVNVIPTQAQTGAHGAYDEVALSRYADAVILMTYDHHTDTSNPGPVSPHNWVVGAVQHTLKAGVPPSKIYLGVNTYGYTWPQGGGKGQTTPDRVAKNLPNKTFHPAKKEYSATANGKISWFPGIRSLDDKYKIATANHLRGLAIWQIGSEGPKFFPELLKLEKGAAPKLKAPTPKAPASGNTSGTAANGA